MQKKLFSIVSTSMRDMTCIVSILSLEEIKSKKKLNIV
jgi:hypothetical protein